MPAPFPTDPIRQHNRFLSALCDDWLEAGTVTRNTPRANAVIEITRQIKQSERGGQSNKRAPRNRD